MKYDFHDFSIDLSDAVEVDRFDDRPHYYGVIFRVATKTTDKFKYQLIHNLSMGYRLHIYDGEGHMRDIPFHSGTESFLPEGIDVKWKNIKES
jgi:hypothetical protein